MKKEAISTFSGGLNYDLNPITTPNNVLTECINGSFITFNGDELALQNDAGNTKIMIPGTEVNPEYVKLTDGFYPMGIKEYGGVLYIVSGKKPDSNGTLFVANQSHLIGGIYYIIELGVNIYYECLSTNSDISLPSTSNTNWKLIGDYNSYWNSYGRIEFGSYPSPEVYSENVTSESIIFKTDPYV